MDYCSDKVFLQPETSWLINITLFLHQTKINYWKSHTPLYIRIRSGNVLTGNEKMKNVCHSLIHKPLRNEPVCECASCLIRVWLSRTDRVWSSGETRPEVELCGLQSSCSGGSWSTSAGGPCGSVQQMTTRCYVRATSFSVPRSLSLSQLRPPTRNLGPPRARSQMDSVTEFWSTCVIKSSKRHLLLFNCSSALWAFTASWTLTWRFCNNHMIKYTLTNLCKPEEVFGGNF